MKIAVCEDSEYFVDLLVECVNRFAQNTSVNFEVDTFLTGDSFRNAADEYDLLILDCKLPDTDGMVLAKELREKDISTTIVFVTAYDDYVYESFEVGAFRYILKSSDSAELDIQMIKALKDFVRTKEKEKCLLIPMSRKQKIVRLDEIVYIEADGRHSIVRLADNIAYNSTKSISEYCDEMKDYNYSFFKTHRQFLVNMKYIKRIDGKEITFDNGEKASISRRSQSVFNKAYNNYLKNFAK